MTEAAKNPECTLLDPWLDLSMLALSGLLFLWPSVKMHQRARCWGGDLFLFILKSARSRLRKLCVLRVFVAHSSNIKNSPPFGGEFYV